MIVYFSLTFLSNRVLSSHVQSINPTTIKIIHWNLIQITSTSTRIEGHLSFIGHGSCTNYVYMLDAYAVTCLILASSNMCLRCLVPTDWLWSRNFPTIKLDKSRYYLYWVQLTINHQIKKILSNSIPHPCPKHNPNNNWDNIIKHDTCRRYLDKTEIISMSIYYYTLNLFHFCLDWWSK